MAWLKVFLYRISYTRNDLVIKMRISSRIYSLGFASVAKSAFESHFQNSIIPGKWKILMPFVQNKFDKFIFKKILFSGPLLVWTFLKSHEQEALLSS